MKERLRVMGIYREQSAKPLSPVVESFPQFGESAGSAGSPNTSTAQSASRGKSGIKLSANADISAEGGAVDYEFEVADKESSPKDSNAGLGGTLGRTATGIGSKRVGMNRTLEVDIGSSPTADRDDDAKEVVISPRRVPESMPTPGSAPRGDRSTDSHDDLDPPPYHRDSDKSTPSYVSSSDTKSNLLPPAPTESVQDGLLQVRPQISESPAIQPGNMRTSPGVRGEGGPELSVDAAAAVAAQRAELVKMKTEKCKQALRYESSS
jgi:hypothetical protein